MLLNVNGDDKDIDIPLRNFMKKRNGKKAKKIWLFMNDLLLNIVNEYCVNEYYSLMLGVNECCVNELFMNDLLFNVAC